VSNEPLLHDETGDPDDVEGFGFSLGALRPEGPPIRPVLDGISLPLISDVVRNTSSRGGWDGNANEPFVSDDGHR